MKYLIHITLLLFFLGGCGKPQQQALPPPPVTMVRPVVCDVNLYTDYVGHMQANVTVQVRAQVSGVITAKYFEEGQDVKNGDLLFTIDDRPYVAALAKAQATLSQTMARLHLAEETVARYTDLVKQKYISQLNYDQYVTEVKVDDATIRENIAEIETAKVNLSYCNITAPMDCTTGVLQIYPGNYINAGGQNQLITLNQISPIQAIFFVPEKDLQNIQFLQRQKTLKTIVYLYDNQEHGYDGELAVVDNQVNANTGSIQLKALLPNKDKALWPGQFVVVRLILGSKKNAILIPSRTIQLGQTGSYVFVIKSDDTVEMRRVIEGQRQGEYSIIEQGIDAGEMVVLDGQLNLVTGIKVSIKNASAIGK
ncbi:MAG: efflux RND transporter periplasmic adaptor subunit [Chlamydiota bacterium]